MRSCSHVRFTLDILHTITQNPQQQQLKQITSSSSLNINNQTRARQARRVRPYFHMPVLCCAVVYVCVVFACPHAGQTKSCTTINYHKNLIYYRSQESGGSAAASTINGGGNRLLRGVRALRNRVWPRCAARVSGRKEHVRRLACKNARRIRFIRTEIMFMRAREYVAWPACKWPRYGIRKLIHQRESFFLCTLFWCRQIYWSRVSGSSEKLRHRQQGGVKKQKMAETPNRSCVSFVFGCCVRACARFSAAIIRGRHSGARATRPQCDCP